MINNVLDRLTGIKKNGKGFTARCPSHSDERNSLAITEKDGHLLLHCFAGCSLDNITSALGIKPSDLFEPTKPQIIATYEYTDETGNPLYRVVRVSPKGFYQQHFKDGQWVNGLNGVEKVPYNLPNVIKADTVYIVEGEADANRLNELGLTATTNSGGAGKWNTTYNDYLTGKRVIIIPDNDEVGRTHAKSIYESLKTKAKVTIAKRSEERRVGK